MTAEHCCFQWGRWIKGSDYDVCNLRVQGVIVARAILAKDWWRLEKLESFSGYEPAAESLANAVKSAGLPPLPEWLP